MRWQIGKNARNVQFIHLLAPTHPSADGSGCIRCVFGRIDSFFSKELKHEVHPDCYQRFIW